MNQPDGRRGQTLVGAMRGQNWLTVTAHGNANRKGVSAKAGDDLRTAVIAKWGTPTARHWRSGRGMNGQLPTQLCNYPGLQDAEKNNYHWEAPRCVESGVGRTVDELVNRAESIYMLGNGVAPVAAAMAFVALWEKLNPPEPFRGG
jgi:hypothetical protein